MSNKSALVLPSYMIQKKKQLSNFLKLSAAGQQNDRQQDEIVLS